MCEERDEDLGVGASPAGDRVPAGRCLVADHDAGGQHDGVVAGDHVVDGAVVGGAAGDAVDGGVDQARVLAGVLVGEGDEGRPERGGGAGAPGRPEGAVAEFQCLGAGLVAGIQPGAADREHQRVKGDGCGDDGGGDDAADHHGENTSPAIRMVTGLWLMVSLTLSPVARWVSAAKAVLRLS
jgi:hypothetical protein